jgi:hypothetical protein
MFEDADVILKESELYRVRRGDTNIQRPKNTIQFVHLNGNTINFVEKH